MLLCSTKDINHLDVGFSDLSALIAEHEAEMAALGKDLTDAVTVCNLDTKTCESKLVEDMPSAKTANTVVQEVSFTDLVSGDVVTKDVMITDAKLANLGVDLVIDLPDTLDTLDIAQLDETAEKTKTDLLGKETDSEDEADTATEGAVSGLATDNLKNIMESIECDSETGACKWAEGASSLESLFAMPVMDLFGDSDEADENNELEVDAEGDIEVEDDEDVDEDEDDRVIDETTKAAIVQQFAGASLADMKDFAVSLETLI